MLAAALAELTSLASVMPFLAVLTDPDQLWGSAWIKHWSPLLGWSSPSDLLLPASVAFSTAAIFAAVIRLTNLWLSSRLTAAIGSDLSSEAYRRTLYQPYSVHSQTNSSTVINSVTNQVSTTVGAINLLLQTGTSTAVAVALLAGLFIVQWQVAILATILLGLSYVIIGNFSRNSLFKNGKNITYSRTQALKSLQEGIGAIRDVLLDGTQNIYLSTYSAFDRPQRLNQAKNQFLTAFPRFSLEAIGLVLIAILATYLSSSSHERSSILPLLGTFALGAQRLLPALQQTYTGWSSLKGFSSDIQGVLHTLNQPLPAVLTKQSPFSLQQGIEFDNVSFSYDGQEASVLEDLSFFIPAGQVIGLVGTTGSGKSTSADLLMGLLTPTQGRIFLDDLDLHDPMFPERLLSWRSSIAHVPQVIYLADGSIAENIAFGVPKDQINLERVHLAAQQAQISDFICSIPDGYQSFVGERGIRLSGGQRQRLGIARALYKQASILIFDEATSALDNSTEQAVMDSINQLDKKITIVMIAHRLTTVAKCDRLIKLHRGSIEADGKPSEVLSTLGQ